jgi:hypothetical protein
LTNNDVRSIVISGTNVFAGTLGGGVWKRLLSEIVGVEEKNEINSMAVYPNPASDFFTLRSNRNNNADLLINIYDAFGTLVKTETLKNDQQLIKVNYLSNGIYIVDIKSGNLTAKQKLIIQR